MRRQWRNFQNTQSEKAILGSACNPKNVSIGISLWLLLAGITMSLSGCGGGPLRAYYYQDDQHYRYYETKSGDVLLVSPDGQVGNASSFVRGHGYPSIVREDRYSVSGNGPKPEPPAPEKSEVSDPKWFPWGNWPLSRPTSEPAAQSPKPEDEPPSFHTLSILGTTTWKSERADWDMAGYDIAPETGACKPYALSVTAAAMWTPYDPFFKKRPCWNTLWDAPASILGDALVASVIVMRIGLAVRGYR